MEERSVLGLRVAQGLGGQMREGANEDGHSRESVVVMIREVNIVPTVPLMIVRISFLFSTSL